MAYLMSHWRGEQPIIRSFWLNGVVLRVVVYGALAALTWAQPLPKFLLVAAIAFDLMVLTWQSVGYFRATEQNLAGSSSMLPLWGGIIALIVAVFVALSQWWGLVLAANPPPEEELFSEKMDRMRAALYELNVDDTGRVISFEGELTHGVTKRLKDILERNPNIDKVLLSSAGGNIFEARGMAKLIHSAEIDTHVTSECSSACTIIFIAGNGRTAGPRARIGFHGYALLNAARLPQFDIEAEQERDRSFFIEQGVARGFAEKIYNQPNSSIWYPTSQELTEASVLRDRP